MKGSRAFRSAGPLCDGARLWTYELRGRNGAESILDKSHEQVPRSRREETKEEHRKGPGSVE